METLVRRKLMALPLIAAVGLGLGMTGTPPAAAVGSTVLLSIDCSTSQDVELVLVAGDTLAVSLSNCGSFQANTTIADGPGYVTYECVPPFAQFIGFTSAVACSGSYAGPGVTAINATVVNPVGLGNALWFSSAGYTRTVYVRSIAAPGPTPEPSSSASGPAPVMQQVELTGGDCEALRRPDLDWAGVESGGWSRSWAEWAGGGRGGAVCTRVLVYRSGAWTVG